MSPSTHPEGPLGWLGDSQRWRVEGISLWQPFEDRLTRALAGLETGQFLICQLTSPTTDGRASRKYLQYALVSDGNGRVLTAEASSLRFQVGLDTSAEAQQSLIDSMGWSRPDGLNHARQFPWPLAIDQAVEQSTRILRDIWRVAHPSQVDFAEVEDFERFDQPADRTAGEVAAELASWIHDAGGTTTELDQEHGCDLVASTAEGDALIHVDDDGSLVEMTSFVGTVGLQGSVDQEIVVALSTKATSGRPLVLANSASSRKVYLSTLHLVDALTPHAFTVHLAWLITSCHALHEHLKNRGLLHSDDPTTR